MIERRCFAAMHERGIEGKIVLNHEFQNWPSVTEQPLIYPKGTYSPFTSPAPYQEWEK